MRRPTTINRPLAILITAAILLTAFACRREPTDPKVGESATSTAASTVAEVR